MAGGQPQPPRLVEAWGVNAGAGFITNPLPVTSQIGVTPGAASLNDGFPPVCFLAPVNGGVLPSGKDFNAILNIISAWAAFFAAGQYPTYDATLQTAMGGYALGARIQQSANSAAFWTSTTAANMTDPDTGGAGWISSVPLHETITAAAGTTSNQVLANASDQILDINTAAGAATFDGFVAQRDGQKLVISCTGANPLTIAALAGTVGNQLRASSGITLLLNDSMTIQFCLAITAWVQV
jgi:hypothetical protein